MEVLAWAGAYLSGVPGMPRRGDALRSVSGGSAGASLTGTALLGAGWAVRLHRLQERGRLLRLGRG